MASPRDEIIEIRDFRGGLNLRASPNNLAPTESRHLRNVVVLNDGSVTARPDYQPLVEAATVNGYPIGDNATIHALGRQTSPHTAAVRTLDRRLVALITINTPPAAASTNTITLGTRPFTPDDIVSFHNKPALRDDTDPRYIAEQVASSSFNQASQFPTTFASVAGVLYVCQFGHVSRWEWNNAGTLTTTLLSSPDEVGRTHSDRLLYDADDQPTGDPDDGTVRDVTTNTSWSEEADHLFSDIYAPVDTSQPVTQRRPRFPTATHIKAIDLESTVIVFAAQGNTLRWSYPLQWADSGYYGVGQGSTGDPGSDWISTHANHRSIQNSQLRLFGPEDWARNAFTQVSAGDGDEITAIEQFQDQILVFTRSSVLGLYGEVGDWRLLPHDRSVGCVGPKALTTTDDGIYFYSHPEGLMLWNGESVVPMSDKLGSWQDRFRPEAELQSQIAVGYHDRKVFLAVPWTENTFERTAHFPILAAHDFTVMCLDLRHQPGVWTEWKADLSAFITLNTGEGAHHLLGLRTGGGNAYYNGSSLTTASDNPTLLVWDGASRTDIEDLEDVNRNYAQANRDTPFAAEIEVGPIRPSEPDLSARWREMTVETNPGGVVESVAVFDNNARDRRLRESILETPNWTRYATLGERSRHVVAELGWQDNRARVISGVSFTYWPSRRGHHR